MRELVNDTLKKLDPEIPYSLDAENLVLGTGAHESLGWTHRKQMGNGPALGYWQMEPFTFNDICNNYLKYHPKLTEKIKQISHVSVLSAIDLINNDRLAICMCRVAYYRQKEAIPDSIEGCAALWKLRYNTIKGAGTEEEFIKNYNEYIS
ncbi:MAG: hypothetical protein PHT07_21010 [Paludibacter sp.]|nr:hypothetical protein [Paludibacter sp.]